MKGFWLPMLLGILAMGVAVADDTVDREYKKTAREYGFQLTSMPSIAYPNLIQGRVVTGAAQEPLLQQFFTALEKLTVPFVRKSGLSKVIFCHGLRLENIPCAGAASRDTIYLNVPFNDKTVYHEMFHVFDKKLTDSAWNKLNPKKFTYRGSNYRPKTNTASQRRKREKLEEEGNLADHFVSDYAQTQENEDRAETFAAMIAEGPKFLLRTEKSPVLKKKMEYIIEATSRGTMLGKDFWPKHLGLEKNAAGQ